jgi:hypothetical protein
MEQQQRTFTAFEGSRVFAALPLEELLPRLKSREDEGSCAGLLVFDDQTGQQLEFDLRGTLEEVLLRALPDRAPAGRGRPRLGVVSREVSLLPRHWEWLEEQPQGASAALRRLVDEARKADPGPARTRRARDALSRVMSAVAGNLPDYEEATRALFAGDQTRFAALLKRWPKDLRRHFIARLADAERLTAPSAPPTETPPPP